MFALVCTLLGLMNVACSSIIPGGNLLEYDLQHSTGSSLSCLIRWDVYLPVNPDISCYYVRDLHVCMCPCVCLCVCVCMRTGTVG